MARIAIVLGSTRPGRLGEAVAGWVHDQALRHGGAEFELVDLKDQDLPLLDEPVPPMVARGQNPHTVRWAEVVAGFDGFVFVTAEYNHGIPAALKNALDFLFAEWNNKAAGFVSYGADGGSRAVAQLRQVMGQLRIADVGAQVTLDLATDFVAYSEFTPRGHHETTLKSVLDDVIAWSDALRALRA